MTQSIGERIKSRRRELGWTARRLSQAAGLSPAFLSDVENGKRGIGAVSLAKLCETLGVSMDFAFNGDGTPEPTRQHVSVPADLAQLAEVERLSFAQTRTLLDVAEALKVTPDWRKLFEAIKGFL